MPERTIHTHIDHPAHDHDHEDCSHGESRERLSAFPSDEENSLLQLAAGARAGVVVVSPNIRIAEIKTLAEEYGVNHIQARLGDRAPQLGFEEYASVVEAFAEGYDRLPTTHPRYEHEHQPDGHHDCGKIHGPLRRRLDTFESKTLGKISNRRAHTIAAVAFRLCALSVCPGDDLVAIGMQVYGAVSGHTSGDRGHEELAVLSRRPRIDFEESKIYLPLDAVVSHEELPATKAGTELRELVEDNGFVQRSVTAKRLAAEAARKPQKRQRRRRIMAFGAMVLGVFGSGSGSSMQPLDNEAAVPAPVREKVAPIVQPDIRQDRDIIDKPVVMKRASVQAGDSQWSMVEDLVKKVTGDTDNAVLNAITAYTTYLNAESHPDADLLEKGDRVWLPAPEVITRIEAAVVRPKTADPVLVRYTKTLNRQSNYRTRAAQKNISAHEWLRFY